MKYVFIIRCGFLMGLVAVLCHSAHAQPDSELPQEVYLYQGDAPGSEGLSQEV